MKELQLISNIDDDMRYQLSLQREHLCQLCVTWQQQVRGIPPLWPVGDSWGPSEAELQKMAGYEVLGSWHNTHADEDIEMQQGDSRQMDSEDDESLDSGSHISAGEYDEFIEAMDAVDFIDGHGTHCDNYLSPPSSPIADTSLSSQRKRARFLL
jgi:hypothetical protein